MTILELEQVLRAWLDYHPFPETWAGRLQRLGAESGPAPFRHVVCEVCEGHGRLRNKRICHGCKGMGEFDVDAYVGALLGVSSNPVDHFLPKPWKDRARTGDEVLDALDLCEERREELECGLAVSAAMRQLEPAGLRWLLVWTYVLAGQLPTHQCLRALSMLHGLIDPGVPVPMRLLDDRAKKEMLLARAKGKSADRFARAERDREIRRLCAMESQQAVAERFGLDKSRVSRIVNAA